MALQINNLTFERNNEYLFSDINENLTPGNILQVRGANGSGKSTLLRILAGLITPEIGSIFWQGKNISKCEDYSREMTYLGHQNGIKPYLTVYENMKLAAALSCYKINHEQLIHILTILRLDHVKDTKAVHLSAGQTRRLALSRLQMSHARLWILDEPTTALDLSGQQLLMDLLAQHARQRGIAIVATHHDLNLQTPIKTLQLDQTHV